MLLINKRKRIRYVSGLISLILLPLLIYHWICTNERFQPKYGIVVAYPPKDTFSPFARIPEREYQDYKLTGDRSSDHLTIEALRPIVRELVVSGDTLKGLRVSLGNKTKYNEFIGLIDMCLAEGMKTFFEKENKFWILNVVPHRYYPATIQGKELKQPPICGTALHSFTCGFKGVNIKEAKPLVNSNWEEVRKHSVKFWPCLLLLGMMVIFNLKRRRPFSK